MSIILFDTETTGLLKPDANTLKEQPEITELYAIKTSDFVDYEELHILLKPKARISNEITRITGITNEMVADRNPFVAHFEEIAAFFLGCDEMVAHNLAFDRSMMANEMLRIDKVLNFPWPPKHTCTVEKSMHIEQRRLNLTKLHEYATGKSSIPDAHRAFGDVKAMLACYLWLKEDGYV